MPLKQSFLGLLFGRIAKKPPDKYSFKAVNSIRSFAQQMLHLAMGNAFLMSAATNQQPLFAQRDMERSTTAQQSDLVKYFVTAGYDFAINGLRSMDASKLNEKTKVFDFEEPRYVFALKAFEHQPHHRGQTTIYIREMGIRPPTKKIVLRKFEYRNTKRGWG